MPFFSTTKKNEITSMTKKETTPETTLERVAKRLAKEPVIASFNASMLPWKLVSSP